MNTWIAHTVAAAAMMAGDQRIPGLIKGRDTSRNRKAKKERARMLTFQRQKELQEKKGNE